MFMCTPRKTLLGSRLPTRRAQGKNDVGSVLLAFIDVCPDLKVIACQ